ncbi:phage major capsid protein, P2 family [Burkholderia thailandensis]|uniref:Phage major capsid protein, P2 family n=1 Tax=Burkholderia thailandensis TaxID=57975 RepID=A0AAW9CZT1_BURTH|nr:phage major capsid protein, P2 family [Burkholderia thailandensis]MCS3399936.1 phage major capsid protein, P2 family [Burkholderia thailandensis]MCS6428804.1 phage major capsid protein, P2 family [Burkholderia thailandensis]MCS6451519.1 phage major capsid protein, P2 family [Burkholderia thailandensis]MCS6467831.1 phage major capsid protein, P2 family [Burkholderia thailandensis]MCS6484211.1 phage major capsid protein, P2 family [Burkholderia thailandensis]
MRKDTRQKYERYAAQIAKLNDTTDVSTKFAVEPTVQQKLETKMQESSEFLARINVLPVTELEGEKLGLSVSGPIASRTDTTKADRKPVDPTGLDSNRYRCEKTDYDTAIPYRKLDAWAKFPDFQQRIRNVIVNQAALDRIMIGWNGVKAAATTDRQANPLLQDVNIGWLQQYRERAAQRVLHEGKQAGKVLVGKDGDYANLDALVMDIVSSMIDPWFQEGTGLVVICGRELLHDKYFPIVNATQAPTERLAADLIVSQKRIGNLPAVRVPHFPKRGLMVTKLDNLSIYFQEGARRRALIDNPKRDQIENYESSNDAYVVEDFGCGCVAENIELVAA